MVYHLVYVQKIKNELLKLVLYLTMIFIFYKPILLSTLFKEVTGINFLQYLNGYRLNMAIDMMKEGGVNISEIAPKCGFQNPGYFAKIFKRYFGMTPTQFRDQL